MAHAAAHDAAEHIASALVGRHDAVRQQEGAGAQMVGDHLVGGVRPAGRGQLGARADQALEQIGVVIAVHALEDRRHALQAHARIDGGPRQVLALIRGDLLILHEDQVPELQEPVAVLLRGTGRTTLHFEGPWS